MHIIGSLNFKGGSAKTTGCWALAGAFSQYYGKKVLVVDADPSANLTAFFRQGIGRTEEFTPSIADVLTGAVTPADCIRSFTFCRAKGDAKSGIRDTFYTDIISPVSGETSRRKDLTPTRACSVDLLPGCKTVESLWDENGPDPDALQKALAPLNYDIILIDFPPETMNITLTALFACQKLLIPAEPSQDSVEGMTDILRTLKDINEAGHQLDILGIYFVRARLNETIQAEVAADISAILGETGYLLPSYVRQSSLCGKCRRYGLMPGVAEPSNSFTKDYSDVAMDVLERLS